MVGLELVSIYRQARIFAFSSFPSTPWHVNVHSPFPLALYPISCSNRRNQNIQKLVFYSLCSAAIQAAQGMQWGEVQHVEVAITLLWSGRGTNVWEQECLRQTRRQTVCLSKDFYSLTSGWSRREKRKANQHPHRQWGHSLAEIMWEGLDPVGKFQVIHLSREQQISDLCLNISEVENGHSPWYILVQYFAWLYRAVIITMLKTKLGICWKI